MPSPPRPLNGTEPHEATDACVRDHCCYHNVDEPLPPREERLPGATICGECFHFYPSWEALLAEHKAGWGEEWGDRPDPEQIYACPLCLHDF